MKISIIVLICVSSILCIRTVEGQLDGLFGSVHKAATSVGKGLGNLFIPNKNKDAGDKKQDVGKTDDDNTKTSTITFPTEETPKVDNTPPSPKADKPASSTTSPKAAANNGKPEDKDGRENFAGGCLAGYMRTADGRCMPTF